MGHHVPGAFKLVTSLTPRSLKFGVKNEKNIFTRIK
jgi:hypothetical protein